MLREYLRSNILITDGAMGTYFTELTGDTLSFCEFANLDRPEVIKKIHEEYIEAGARLIRTNTFSANTLALHASREKVREIITKGYLLAQEAAADQNVFIGASIGPIPDTLETDFDILAEYKFIIDSFLAVDAKIFIFETFSSLDYLEEITAYIKSRNKDAFILTQFAITLDGFTRKGLSMNGIVNEVKKLKNIDTFGFNCGSGPTHLYKLLQKVDSSIFDYPISVLPNAGYPEIRNERTIYVNNPEYFAELLLDIKNLGVKIIGGCCGTTPAHIEKLTKKITAEKNISNAKILTTIPSLEKKDLPKETNNFLKKLQAGEFVVAIELDTPFDTDLYKVMHGAQVCKDNAIDLITIADSPRAIARVDSVMTAAKIKREIGIDVMPHLCCRDRNINAIRSTLLASHIEGIRNILAVTGDPVSESNRAETKSVFNLNSFKLMELITEMNKEVFTKDTFNIGGALNLNMRNKEVEISRMERKLAKGSTFFLTQPIFDEEAILWLQKLKERYEIKILGGIMPIVSYKNAQFLNNEVPGINIPDQYLNLFKMGMSREEAEQIGIDLAVELTKNILNHVDGLYYIAPFNRVEMVIKILKKVNLVQN